MADSEWEYEYDATETETFYFTIDLTTHVPPRLGKSSTDKQSSKPPNKALAAVQDTDDVQSEVHDGSVQPSPPPQHQSLQIMDLHSRNPLIVYDNQFYTCHWATDIGTSMFISPHGEFLDDHPPLRSYKTFDLLGNTSARLMAVPAEAEARMPLLESAVPPLQGDTAQDIVSKTSEGDTIRYSQALGLRIETPSNAPTNKVNQARFLERLSAIKLKRGETDPVPVSFIKTYSLPEGWEAERDEWLAKQTMSSERAKKEVLVRNKIFDERRKNKQERRTVARKRKRRKRRDSPELEDDDQSEAGEPGDEEEEAIQHREDGAEDEMGLDRGHPDRTTDEMNDATRKRSLPDDNSPGQSRKKRSVQSSSKSVGRPRNVDSTVAESSATAAAREGPDPDDIEDTSEWRA